MELYRSGRYAELNPSWHAEDAEHKARQIEAMMRYCGLHPGTVADVGCGNGEVLRRLKRLRDAAGERDTIYEGWDIASVAIRQARELEDGRLLFVGEDFLQSERRVDLLLCIDTFEHVPDDIGFLSALRDRAEWFLFRIPLELSALDVVRPKRILAARRRWGHRHAYNRAIAHEVLREAGYHVDSETYDRIPPITEGPRHQLIDAVRSGLFRLAPHGTVGWLGGWSLVVCARAA